MNIDTIPAFVRVLRGMSVSALSAALLLAIPFGSASAQAELATVRIQSQAFATQISAEASIEALNQATLAAQMMRFSPHVISTLPAGNLSNSVWIPILRSSLSALPSCLLMGPGLSLCGALM